MHTTSSLRAGAAVFATSLFLTSCSAAGTDAASTDVSATPAEAGSDTVVATTHVWADVASSVLGSEVPAVISNPSTDPHEFEPAAADLAKVTEAGLLVANGGAYDHAIYSAAEPDKVISALPLTEGGAHDHAHGAEGEGEAAHDHEHEGEHEGEGEAAHAGHDHAHGENEHIWYSTDAVRDVAEKLSDAAENKGLKADTAELDKRLDAVDEKFAALPAARIAQTHPIADAIVEDTELEDVTPEDYRSATLNETEPSSAAVAALISQLESGEVDLLINNPQTPSALTDRILQAAKDNNVPVVDITETPQDGKDFFDYLDEIASALSEKLAQR